MDDVLVDTCETIADNVVQVKGWRTGTRAPREFTVHFTRRGEIKFGHLWIPYHDETYVAGDALPESVRQAALQHHRRSQ